MLFIANHRSAIHQAAINFKAIYYPNLEDAEQLKGKMALEPFITAKLYFKNFLKNWPLTPYNTLIVLLIVILVIVLYLPAWLIRSVQRGNKLDLTDERIRTNYFLGYFLFFALLGSTLSFIS